VTDEELRRQARVVARQLWSLLGELVLLVGLLARRGWQVIERAREMGFRASVQHLGSVLGRAAGFAAAAGTAFVLITALAGRQLAGASARTAIGLLVVLLPFGLARVFPSLRRSGLATSWQTLAVAILFLVFGRETGAALRRHGDWFLGRSPAARTRASIAWVGALLEGFELPVEMTTHELPLEGNRIVFGPFRPGEEPYAIEPPWVHWVHPLAGPVRSLPSMESRRFGGARTPPRPPECELGHCGVDLAAPSGEPVFAVADAVIERIERDAAAGGSAGRYVRLGHLGGTVVTRYMHLSVIRADLREGARIVAGERLGGVGRSGVDENFPHLHFGLSRRTPAAGERYLDPEPFLRVWELPRAESAAPR
jgi:hypothetical protein